MSGWIVPIVLALVVVASACGSPGDERTGGSIDSSSAVGPGLNVDEARSAETDEPVLVNGFVVARDGEVRLCSVLLESYPPQCGDPSLTVEGADLTDYDLSSGDGVRWSDEQVQVLGRVDGDVLRVESTSV